MGILLFMTVFVSRVHEDALERIASLTELKFTETFRFKLYKMGFQQGVDSYGLGGGLGSYQAYAWGGHGGTVAGRLRYTHNLLLEIWGELGIVGVFLFGALIYSGIRTFFRWCRMTAHDVQDRITVVGLGAVTLFGLAQSMTTADMAHQEALWLGLGLFACAIERTYVVPGWTYAVEYPPLEGAPPVGVMG